MKTVCWLICEYAENGLYDCMILPIHSGDDIHAKLKTVRGLTETFVCGTLTAATQLVHARRDVYIAKNCYMWQGGPLF